MNWFSLTIIALGLILGYSKHRGQPPKSASSANSDQTKKAHRNKPEKPWRSDELDELIDASKFTLDLVHRHTLLTNIIKKAHKQYADASMKKIFHRFARIHLDEFPELAPALKSRHGGSLPEIPSFKLCALVFEREQDFAAAIAVCKMAIKYGIDDGTRSGFNGRLKRLQKKQGSRQP